ncbi:proline iminopeptidase [Planococcus antarcticus DSM 14505]|uniref:Proline iminopeptidase n=1 Tax=Planococcus antarcticus DSM 14505 TaxID=1185653 RepID=A0A1C7DH91_9BACL|nr:proline iminopeptidase-family hydrolase [Planococcus antarcticus]ANU10835.1 proline iminopeptidase [Planococcus antarcticus DSM 14505]EIM06002.1 proline iminopeptidase [Planococcus antarcticus DSM 14505]
MGLVSEGYIPVTGGKVWYQVSGDGPGIPLLVLHGGPGGKSSDSDPLCQLGTDRPVIHFDQLGCGKSDRPTNTELWTVERYVEELRQVIDALKLEEVHILGHSWGTMLAASYLLGKPDGVRSIIFSGPALDAQRWERDQRNYLKQLPQDIQDTIEQSEQEGTTDSAEYNKAMMAFYKRHMCRVDPWPKEMEEDMEEMNQQIYNFMWGASEFTVTGTLKNFDVTGRLHEITIPTLFTCGRFDEATPEATEYYVGFVPNAEFHVFENSSHMPGIEEPKAYVAMVREWLNRQEFRPGA